MNEVWEVRGRNRDKGNTNELETCFRKAGQAKGR